jgi:hypothetical protein
VVLTCAAATAKCGWSRSCKQNTAALRIGSKASRGGITGDLPSGCTARNDAWILYATIVAAICIPLALIQELTRRKPFLDLRLQRNRGLGPSALVALGLGLRLCGTVYVLPLYLAQIQGYDALRIGEVVMWLDRSPKA